MVSSGSAPERENRVASCHGWLGTHGTPGGRAQLSPKMEGPEPGCLLGGKALLPLSTELGIWKEWAENPVISEHTQAQT